MGNSDNANTQYIELYAAIREMDRISKEGGTFSLSFYKYDRQRQTGGDLARISRAQLRRKASSDNVQYADYKLFFTDMDSGKARVCWQVLIVEFNGLKITM